MGERWEFTAQSQELFQRCVSAAIQDEKSKTWQLKLRPSNFKRTLNTESDSGVTKNEKPELVQNKIKEDEITDDSIVCEANVDIEGLTTDSNINLYDLEIEYTKNPNFLRVLVNKAPLTYLQRLSLTFFAETTCNEHFIDDFYRNCLPVYFERVNSRCALDLLVKANVMHRENFKNLLIAIITDFKSPILQDYVMTLDEDAKSDFLNIVIDISSDAFSNNLLTIYTAYKDCNKTVRIQNFVQTNLFLNRHILSVDRDFGRLLLTFLQAEKNLSAVNLDTEKIAAILDIHQSPFKRPCLNLFKELLDKT